MRNAHKFKGKNRFFNEDFGKKSMELRKELQKKDRNTEIIGREII